MPILSRNLPKICHLRRMATKTHLEHGQHPNSVILKAVSGHRRWPAREENFAADQIHRQKQPMRKLSHRPISQLDMGMFRPVTMPDQAYVPALPNRNNMAAAQNAFRGRSLDGYPMRRREEKIDPQRNAKAESYSEDQLQQQQQQQEQQMESRPEIRSNADQDFESDMEVRSVRETVFGKQDDTEEDERLRAQADAELLHKVSRSKRVVEVPKATISRKVITPYNSYRKHRTRWAEFRHSMIYGRGTF